jgi:dTDP-glucose 4,6-dehydratase/UDP-glucuronate decarboxylase
MTDYSGKANEVVGTDLEYIARQLDAEFATMAGKQLLIVGGAGFLGHYMVQSVLHWNRSGKGVPIKLTVYDSWVRGVPGWLKARESDENLRLVTHDITNPVPSSQSDFDYVVHAASIASPIYYRLHPIETMDANVEGLRHLLNHAVKLKEAGKPLSGFLFFSTSEIYGDPTPDNIPTPETYRGNVSCTGPRACYDESKRYGETLSVNFARQHEIPITIARPFNNYGPGLKITDRRVLSDYARDIFAGRDIEMLSSGTPTRTFCYVADAVVGYYKILVRGRAGEAYNIGNPSPEISMRDLAERVVAIARAEFGYEGQVVLAQSDDKDYLVDNPNRRCPVIDKAQSELGFSPQIGLEEGLVRSLRWYAGNRVAEDL